MASLMPFHKALAQSHQVSILNSSSYVDAVGWLHVVGEVKNTSTNTINYVNIVATFYDSANKVVGTSFTYSTIGTLRPQEKSPFNIILYNNEQTSKTSSYKLTASADLAVAKPANLALKTGDSYYDAVGWFHQVGEVTNKGDKTATFVLVAATFFDSSGKPRDAAFTYTQPADIPPGATAPFELISFGDLSRAIVSASVNVQSEEYSMIDSSLQKTDQPKPSQTSQSSQTQKSGSISGKYIDSKAGYEITFPKGWSGTEFMEIATIVAPGGVDFIKGYPKTYIMTVYFNMTAAKDLWGSTTGQSTVDNTCKQISNRYVTLNKVRGYETVQECTTNDGFSKSKYVYFATKDLVIAAGLSADSKKAFTDNLKVFDESVKTLKVQKQIDIKTLMAKVAGIKTTNQKIDGKSTKFETSSTLSDFKFDKAKKTLSFSANGKKDAAGSTAISIGKLLKGPFSVTIDGKTVTNFSVIEDTTSKETLISINYDHSKKHTIVITGKTAV